MSDRRLSPPARILLAAEILQSYIAVRVLVRRCPLPETIARLRATRRVTPAAGDDLALGRHLAWATVRTITLLPADSRCLMRSLVLTRLMARRGIPTTFVLSAAPSPSFESHAWVEHGGEPLLAPGGPDHGELLRL